MTEELHFHFSLSCIGEGDGNGSSPSLTRMGFSGGSDSKESACNAGDPGSVPRWERSPGKGNSYPLQYFCLENCMDRGTWWAIVHGVTKNWTQLSD